MLTLQTKTSLESLSAFGVQSHLALDLCGRGPTGRQHKWHWLHRGMTSTRTLELRDTREVPAIARAPKAPKGQRKHRLPVGGPKAVRAVALSLAVHVLGVREGAQIRQACLARGRPECARRAFIQLNCEVLLAKL